MALTITIEGKGVIANSDGLTDSAGGSWTELGAGSISLSTETYLYGSSCVAGAYSNKAGWHYFDIGSGNELDFDTAGSEEGQFIYLPIFNPTPGLNESISNGGLRIRIGSSTTAYREWMILASDDFNEWTGSWKTFVLDPTKPGSVSDTGSFDVGAVRYIGIYVDATALAKGDNIFIDQIAVGFGLRVTGTSTTGWQDLVDYCTDYPNRAWGMVEKRGDTIYVKGKIFIGATDQTAATSFADSGKIIQFEKSEYYYSAAWVSTLPTDACGIVLEDHASNDSYTTTYSDGVAVGSDAGRSGSSISGNDNENVEIDFSGLTRANSLITLYGTKFNKIYGQLDFTDDSNHKYFSCSFADCVQVVPGGAAVIRNCIFAETADADAALLWDEDIDIQDCNFIANTTGAAIEMPSAAGTPYSYTRLYFDGNTYDVLNSSGSAITINKSGTPASDPSTYEGSSVTFQGSVDITITVKDADGNVLENVQTAVYKLSDRSELMNEDTNASGVAAETYSGSTPVNVEVRCRKASTGATKYLNFSSNQEISSSGLTMTVTLLEDPNNP